MNIKRMMILGFILFIFSINVNANPASLTLDALQRIAKQAVLDRVDVPAEANISIQVQRLDNRFILPKCKSPVIGELVTPQVNRHNTVKLSCDSLTQDYPWQTFVTVTLNISYKVVVTTKIIPKGERLSKDNITLKYIDEYGLRGGQFKSLEAVIGTRVKRRISSGKPIYNKNICFVCKGDTVSVFARSQNFQIKTSGSALNDGNLNQKIRIKNPKSNKIFAAEVTGIGEVSVKM
ncbi:MAG: flagellar basal body P-ring formation chaperone FlgA [Parashewanella sp.]